MMRRRSQQPKLTKEALDALTEVMDRKRSRKNLTSCGLESLDSALRSSFTTANHPVVREDETRQSDDSTTQEDTSSVNSLVDDSLPAMTRSAATTTVIPRIKAASVVQDAIPGVVSKILIRLGIIQERQHRTWSQPYDPPPMISKEAILLMGFILFGLAQLWPPMILLIAYLVAKLIPYSCRWNDYAAERRRLFQEFLTDPHAPEEFRIIPDYVDYQQSYWINDRYVVSSR
jgi:hypothetical protein